MASLLIFRGVGQENFLQENSEDGISEGAALGLLDSIYKAFSGVEAVREAAVGSCGEHEEEVSQASRPPGQMLGTPYAEL